MNRRYKKWTEATDAFWGEIIGHLKRARLTCGEASIKMGGQRTNLRTTMAQGCPLSPDRLNAFCEAVEATHFERERLHTLAARGVGYEVNP